MRPLVVFAYLGAIAGSLVSIPAVQAGKVRPPRIDELVETSERIVLAKVEGVSYGLARATVQEVWKGPKVEAVEYWITPNSVHDISKAVPGETVLLFLRMKQRGWEIAWLGRGRMTLGTQDSKVYVSDFHEETFPANTPSVALTGGKPGRDDRGIELKLVKELVDRAIAAGKK